MSDQDNGQLATLQRPTTDNREDWQAYWKQQKQPWRTEPEIDIERQKYLTECNATVPDIGQGIYPFKDIKLDRADVEWLLAKHKQLPKEEDWWIYKRWQPRPHLNLQGANFSGAHAERAGLESANLDGAMLASSYLEEAYLYNASLNRANLAKANLVRANLGAAHLEAAYFYDAHLEGASLRYAHLVRTNLGGAHLGGCDLSGAFFSSATSLDKASLTDRNYGCVLLSQVHWEQVDLSGIDWSQVSVLGDEQEADRPVTKDGKTKSPAIRVAEYQIAMRANRQLSIVLQAQGLNEDAARFAYRAQKLQRIVLRKQKRFGQYLFSLFLDLLTGYGYKPLRGFITYAVAISVFALIYFLLGPHLAWNEAFVISMTAFHGRGFFPEQFKPGDPQALVAAIEAFVGLLIEVTFIATLTQRLFGK